MAPQPWEWPKISGYLREDGSIGVRNRVIVMAAADNVNPVAYRLAGLRKGTTCIPATFGRGLLGDDLELYLRSMADMIGNPNVAAALIISFEPESAERIRERAARFKRPVKTMSLLEAGGLSRSLQEGGRILDEMLSSIDDARRAELDPRRLVLGLECGGSDATSGLFGNPAVGLLTDAWVEKGATALFSEPVELVGCEEMLSERAATPRVAADIRSAVGRYLQIARNAGIDLTETNPTPDNMKGGLSTIEEKSLGAVLKSGSSRIEGVVGYGERPPAAGLWLMDAPAAAVENTTALAAGGCHVILFVTGTVNPVGNPLAPTIKICANPVSTGRMGEHVDVDLSSLLEGGRSTAEGARLVHAKLCGVLAGEDPAADRLGYHEIRVSRVGPSV